MGSRARAAAACARGVDARARRRRPSASRAAERSVPLVPERRPADSLGRTARPVPLPRPSWSWSLYVGASPVLAEHAARVDAEGGAHRARRDARVVVVAGAEVALDRLARDPRIVGTASGVVAAQHVEE